MCLYWKKMHTCDHLSDRPYIEMCRPGFLTNTVCPSICEDPAPRKSFFPCYQCIKTEARTEADAKNLAVKEALEKADEARERHIKEKKATELRVKEERVRREAREKAARERDDEMKSKRMKEDEERKAKKEGGLWIETGSGKKGKGRKGAAGIATTPVGSMKTANIGVKREYVALDRESPKKERVVDPGGRAGTWGPKKILSRKENAGVVNGAVGGVHSAVDTGASGAKK